MDRWVDMTSCTHAACCHTLPLTRGSCFFSRTPCPVVTVWPAELDITRLLDVIFILGDPPGCQSASYLSLFPSIDALFSSPSISSIISLLIFPHLLTFPASSFAPQLLILTNLIQFAFSSSPSSVDHYPTTWVHRSYLAESGKSPIHPPPGRIVPIWQNLANLPFIPFFLNNSIRNLASHRPRLIPKNYAHPEPSGYHPKISSKIFLV